MESNLAYEYQEEEIIGGKVVMMAAPALNHTFISGNIFGIFRDYLRGKRCTPIPDGAALFLEDGREEYRPDGMVVCDPDKLKTDGVHGAPDLVVEVLSPSTGRYDRGRKMRTYEKHGVREYWLVSPEARTVEQYVLEDGRFAVRDVYTHYTENELRRMKEADRAEVVTEFQCTLFDDLTIKLEDIFYRVMPDA